jgi:uncharacterized membrane protein SpoIIM required for sporulation
MEGRDHCGVHPEFVKATADLMSAVGVLSNNIKWIVAIGKGLLAVGLALIVTVIFAIFYAGSLVSQVETNGKEIAILSSEVRIHMKDKNAHHD